MYKFSKRSKSALDSAHPSLQLLFNEVIQIIDCTVIFGHRNKKEQEHQFHLGHTKLRFPKSKHNSVPSNAVDVVPYPIDWNDRERFVYFAGIVKGIASQLGIKYRWGGDWNSNNDLKDQTWMDLPHYELLK